MDAGGHDNSQKVPAPAGNAAVSPIAKKARTTDEVLFDGKFEAGGGGGDRPAGKGGLNVALLSRARCR